MKPILKVENLNVNLINTGLAIPVLLDISFEIYEEEILALAGESGSGKSLTAMALTRILPNHVFEFHSGKILYGEKDLLREEVSNLQKIRGKEISYIFQDPFTSLNPLKKIKDQMLEGFLLHISKNKKEGLEKAEYLLSRVGITDLKQRLNSYPKELSGGMLQRVAIAMALMCDPKLLIADEPTSALDVTVQAGLVGLLTELRKETKMSMLFISHDLGLVAALADRIAILYAGEIVEVGNTNLVIENPKHPYTMGLIESVTSSSLIEKQFKGISGTVPTPANFPNYCHFADRCEKAFEPCKKSKPEFYRIDDTRMSRCFLEKR
ncbi:MAG: ABC transporter ATP-binding protein [Leptospiraceae bacterium]|nr:ABC transporter ATP-binding protein [Leptospiraceae bacterium]